MGLRGFLSSTRAEWSFGAWIDVANASDADMERLNNAIRRHLWTLGHDREPEGQMPPDSDPITAARESFIKNDVSGVAWWGSKSDDNGFHVAAVGVQCDPVPTGTARWPTP